MNTEQTIQKINIDLIIPNRFQPRLTFDEQGINELSTSIKEHGIIQPLVVRPLGDKYEIIAGERRFKAATLAGLTEVPVIISNLDDNQSAEVALVENVQRRDLSSIEEAKSYKKILDKGYLTQEQLAKRMGISQSAIANKLRLLNLASEIQDALMNEKISERHARSLLQITNPEEQVQMLNRTINERLTVRQLDNEIKKSINPVTNPPLIFNTPINQMDLLADSAVESHTTNEVLSKDNLLDPHPSTNDFKIETLDIDSPSLEPSKDSKDIVSQAASKIINIFEQPTFPSLEDEVVNLNTDVKNDTASGFNPFATEIDSASSSKNNQEENLKEEVTDANLELLEIIPTEVTPNEPKKVEKTIKSNDLASVSEAYHKLENEIKTVGYKITSEEFDFEDLYQIIIKIEK